MASLITMPALFALWLLPLAIALRRGAWHWRQYALAQAFLPWLWPVLLVRAFLTEARPFLPARSGWLCAAPFPPVRSPHPGRHRAIGAGAATG